MRGTKRALKLAGGMGCQGSWVVWFDQGRVTGRDPCHPGYGCWPEEVQGEDRERYDDHVHVPGSVAKLLDVFCFKKLRRKI